LKNTQPHLNESYYKSPLSLFWNFPLYLKGKHVHTSFYVKGVHLPSPLQPFAGVKFDFGEKIAKNRKKSI
jgi:hypothetical protein